MSDILTSPTVTAIDGGYRVANPEAGLLRVYRNPYGMWAVFFDSSTPGDLHPADGLMGSFSGDVEDTVEWALRTEEATS